MAPRIILLHLSLAAIFGTATSSGVDAFRTKSKNGITKNVHCSIYGLGSSGIYLFPRPKFGRSAELHALCTTYDSYDDSLECALACVLSQGINDFRKRCRKLGGQVHIDTSYNIDSVEQAPFFSVIVKLPLECK